MRPNLLFPIALLSVLLFAACSSPEAELAKTEPIVPVEANSDLQPARGSNSGQAPKATATTDSDAMEVATTQPVVANRATNNQITTDNSSAADLDSTKSALSPDEEAAAKKLAERTAASRTAIADLDQEFKTAVLNWQTNFRAAQTSTERDRVRKEKPGDGFAKKYLELASEFSGTPVATQALTKAIQRGGDETTKLASKQLLELAEMNSGTLESEGMLILVANYGDDESKLKATQVMADIVTKAPESDVAKRICSQVLKLKDNSPGKTRVAQSVLDLADLDISSNKALDQLLEVAMATTGATKSAALSRISTHFDENKNIIDVIRTISEGGLPDQATETWLKETCLNSTNPAVKGRAAISLKSVIDKRDMFRSILGGGNEETRATLGEELLAYLEKDPDPSELDLIETTLDSYISSNEALLKNAKNELYVIKHLSIGKVAQEIASADTDGVDFKLSDYRGKVVFLDFWGDW